MGQRKYLILGITTALLSCTQHIPPQPTTELIPSEFPEAYYHQAKTTDSIILRVDSKRSIVTINVFKGGILSRLGHDHVVASRDVSGYVDLGAGRADLLVPLDKLTVDEAELRKAAALTTTPTAEAIAGTRRNMLDKVLESSHYPFALIHIKRNVLDNAKLDIKISLHGSTHSYEIPAQIKIVGNEIQVSGEMKLNQSDFGISPFSILGGALQVLDELELKFLIVAASF